MKFSLTSHRLNIVLLVLLILIGLGSFAYNQYLIDRILKQERSIVELWAKAMEYTGNPSREDANRRLREAAAQLAQNPAVSDSLVDVIKSAESNRSTENFVLENIILKDQFRIPTIIVDQKGEILYGNHISGKLNKSLIKEFAAINPPIEIHLGSGEDAPKQFVYYGEGPTVQYLRYFPYIQLSLLALLLGMAFVSFRTINTSEQSNIWVGMTKEAAHQLGTPLSSLYGWIELLREEKKEDPFIQKICDELEDDAVRLRGVAERFNKIGSKPELEQVHLVHLVETVIDYMERRLPKLGKNVEIKRSLDPNAQAMVNPELFRWALENILKNAMNAIKSTRKGAYIAVTMQQKGDELHIDIEDSGRGIEKKYHSEIFNPGYSTKKRGWGLGLSLTRRIIKNYHKGQVFVLHSQVGKGTTIRIVLKKNPGHNEALA